MMRYIEYWAKVGHHILLELKHATHNVRAIEIQRSVVVLLIQVKK